MRAQWIAGALEDRGIKTFVDEDNLADEFAVSQRLMGMPRIRVMVLQDELTEARTIFLNLSQPITIVDEDDEQEDDDEIGPMPGAGPKALAIVFGALLLLALGGFLLSQCAEEKEDDTPWRHQPPPRRR